MASYIPTPRSMPVWSSTVKAPEHRAPYVFGPIHSGSQRNYGGNYSGAPEFSTPTVNKLSSFAQHNIGNLLLYGELYKIEHKGEELSGEKKPPPEPLHSLYSSTAPGARGGVSNGNRTQQRPAPPTTFPVIGPDVPVPSPSGPGRPGGLGRVPSLGMAREGALGSVFQALRGTRTPVGPSSVEVLKNLSARGPQPQQEVKKPQRRPAGWR